ncbi:MAG: site-specific integrase [Cyclobacteriaceae bacterium]
MATCTLFLDTRNKKTTHFPLVLRISHKGNRKDLPTAYKLLLSDWNDKKKLIKASYPNSGRANAQLKSKVAIATDVIAQHQSLAKTLTASDLAAIIKQQIDGKEVHNLSSSSLLPFAVNANKTTLKKYGKKVIERYQKANRFGMVRSFEDAIQLLTKFHGSDRLLLTDIDETFLEDLEADYIGKGRKINGLSVRLRAIRRIFNLAIKDKQTELTANDYPFGNGGYSIKKEKSQKRAVKLDVIDAIRQLEYEEGTALWHHRNYFIFMFNMRGMNFIDLAFLKNEAIVGDRIRYKRRKTKRGKSVKEFNIKITDEAQRIINYYEVPKTESSLVFPIMRDVIDTETEERIYTLYQSRMHNHNRRLNSIGKAIGLDIKLTTYVARHTFATAGLHIGISKAQIGDMLGHTNYYTTEAYFDDFDKEVLDDAADKILN